MRIISNYDLRNLKSPRWGEFQVVNLFDGDLWINLNDITERCKSTTTSALASLANNPELTFYIKCNPQNPEYVPFVNKEGFLIAELGRPTSYKKNILTWIQNEMKKIPLPTFDRMLQLAAKPTLQNSNPTLTDTPQQEEESNLNLMEFLVKYRPYGLNYTCQQFLSWLIIHNYVCHSKDSIYRPKSRSYERGYFVDNRKTFNTMRPYRDLIITPKGQKHFIEQLLKK